MKNLLQILTHDKVQLMWLSIMIGLMISSFINGEVTSGGVLMLVSAYSFRGMYWEWLYKREISELRDKVHHLNQLLLKYRS